MARDDEIRTEVATAVDEQRTGPSGCVLFVSDGEPKDKGKTYTLERGTARVGSGEGCELRLNDRKVSRMHAEISVTEEGVALRDLDSTNGTYYVGSRIKSAQLLYGAEVRVGKTRLVILPISNEGDIEPETESEYGELLGASTPMRRLFSVMKRLEGSEAPVFVHGETGVGKELVARTLHANSPRADGPFVVLDCGAVPDSLVDSHLFGHVRGAFTGAIGTHTGVFERADGGTLLIDEIAELPVELQPRLLRVLETGQLQRVGDSRLLQVDVRIVAASHQDLFEEVRTGRFRQDLFYRLAVVRLEVPPLRLRTEDIPLLARLFVQDIAGPGKATIPDRVLSLMGSHPWPGNVRELRNVVHRMLSLGDQELMKHATGPLGGPAQTSAASDGNARLPYKEAREQVVGEFEAAYVQTVLERAGGNISKAARTAGITRRYLKELMRKHRFDSKS